MYMCRHVALDEWFPLKQGPGPPAVPRYVYIYTHRIIPGAEAAKPRGLVLVPFPPERQLEQCARHMWHCMCIVYA